MLERCGFPSDSPKRINKVRVREVADRQFGLVSRAQLRHIRIAEATIHDWIEVGYLVRVLPRVYAVGHRALSVEADLFATILYAGPGAMLSHSTAAWWSGWIDYPVSPIHVTTPRDCGSLPGRRVHARRNCGRRMHRGMPITTPIQTMLDLAATEPLQLVRKALANLDYQRRLNAQALRDACGRGRPGSAKLKQALARFEPRYARTNHKLEEDFLAFCERERIPLPQVNVEVHGIKVDAYWPAQQLVVELDGEGNHGTWPQIKRDRSHELILRGHDVFVVRYDWDLVHDEPQLVREDLLGNLEARS
jgi:hypothetical protein